MAQHNIINSAVVEAYKYGLRGILHECGVLWVYDVGCVFSGG